VTLSFPLNDGCNLAFVPFIHDYPTGFPTIGQNDIRRVIKRPYVQLACCLVESDLHAAVRVIGEARDAQKHFVKGGRCAVIPGQAKFGSARTDGEEVNKGSINPAS
jgi:hypothetical protein